MTRSPALLSRLGRLWPLALILTLGGCDLVVMKPVGYIAQLQARLILWSTVLMLVIIVPVMVLTVVFAWRYRETNDAATYEPDWDHSTGLELVIWAMPLLIVIALGALTWLGTHTLDPYRPLARTAVDQPLAKGVKPLEIQVVSLDWKWLFIYPEQGVATVNELVVPVGRPVKFRMTSSSVMNTFWVPTMAGMIYTMPGMETTLHGVLSRAGRYEGRSANYSGAGFSDMTFWTHAVDAARFDRWAAGVRAQPRRLDTATYLKLERPSERVAPVGFSGVDGGLYARIVGMCVKPGTSCMQGMQANDRAPRADEAKGALTRPSGQKGEGQNRDVPRGNAPGAAEPGSPANRNMTWLAPRPAAGATALA